MIDTGAFKSAIIDLAVTGRLSSKLHTEDSVDDIIAALPPLSNKRKKLLGQNFEYGKLSSIPDHWRWICLGEISSYGDTPQKAYSEDVSGDTWILDLEDIKSGGQILKKTRVHGKYFIGDKTVFSKGQVLYSKLRPYLKKVLVADEDGISTPELISFDAFGGMIPQYLVYCLLSTFTDRAIEKRSYGIKMPRIDAGFMVNLPIPVPPVSEQQYIVDRVQETFSQIDIIDALQEQYADNLTALKSKLIDAAIQGKLTEQLPEDGTAEDLYQQIQVEKQELIKAGKIKRDKPLPDITEGELSFEIPVSWKMCRLGSIITLVSGTDYKPEEYNDENRGTPYITGASNLLPDGVLINRWTETPRCIANTGDVLLVCKGSGYGKVAMCDVEEAHIARQIMAIKKTELLDMRYILYFLTANFGYLKGKGQGLIPGVDRNSVLSMVFPLPPLAEQIRIVAKLDELVGLIET